MRAVRRAVTAMGLAGLVAAVMRLRGGDVTPPQPGGWRELTADEIRNG